MNIIQFIFPKIDDEEKIGDIASGLSSCGYSIGDFAGPFFGGIFGAAMGFQRACTIMGCISLTCGISLVVIYCYNGKFLEKRKKGELYESI